MNENTRTGDGLIKKLITLSAIMIVLSVLIALCLEVVVAASIQEPEDTEDQPSVHLLVQSREMEVNVPAVLERSVVLQPESVEPERHMPAKKAALMQLIIDPGTINERSEESSEDLLEDPVPESEEEPMDESVYDMEPQYDGFADALARLLYCEAGSASWECQVWTCSAILNLLDYFGEDIWTAMHNPNRFSVAGYVDYVVPSQTQYDVIAYVQNGGRIWGVHVFRTGCYHDFGTPVYNIDGVYFSSIT